MKCIMIIATSITTEIQEMCPLYISISSIIHLEVLLNMGTVLFFNSFDLTPQVDEM